MVVVYESTLNGMSTKLIAPHHITEYDQHEEDCSDYIAYLLKDHSVADFNKVCKAEIGLQFGYFKSSNCGYTLRLV